MHPQTVPPKPQSTGQGASWLRSNVQFQKISILPPQKGLEFPAQFCEAKKIKEIHEA